MRSLIRFPEYTGMATLQERLNRLFDEFFGESLPAGQEGQTWVPAWDVIETPEALLVRVELPGVDPSTVETCVSGDYLEISGEKPAAEAPKDARWYRFERLNGKFRRTLQLPFPVDAEKVEAEAKHGLLEIRLPKAADVMPKRIRVKAAE